MRNAFLESYRKKETKQKDKFGVGVQNRKFGMDGELKMAVESDGKNRGYFERREGRIKRRRRQNEGTKRDSEGLPIVIN